MLITLREYAEYKSGEMPFNVIKRRASGRKHPKIFTTIFVCSTMSGLMGLGVRTHLKEQAHIC